MAQNYLEKYRTSLPSSQGNQVLKRLISERDSGKIATTTELKDKLKQLTTDLLKEKIKPTLQVYQAIVGEDISSEQFNDMLEHIEDDLTTAFTEADNVDEIIATHHNLIDEVALKTLRFSINQLEAKITIYEYLSQTEHGFDDVLFDTFREDTTRLTSRTDSVGNVVYMDPRRNELTTKEKDASVDTVGERLTLGNDLLQYTKIRNALWLTNTYSQHGELEVSLPNSSILNILDGQNNTYWIVPVMLTRVQPDGVFIEICLQFAGQQDINFVEIEPAVDYPVHLVQIDYFSGGRTRTTIYNTETEVNSPVKLHFARITTEALVLRFRQDNYTETQFKNKLGESNLYRAALNETFTEVDIDSASEDLQEKLTSDFVLTDVLAVPSNTNPLQKFYQYTFGLDNVRAGYSTFDEESIFVAPVKTVEQPMHIGLEVLETRPIQNWGTTDISVQTFNYPTNSITETGRMHHACVEYWLVIQSFTSGGSLITTDTVPILPIGASRIYHEQLILTHMETTTLLENNMGSFMHYCAENKDDVLVYRNGRLLDYSLDWDFVSEAENSSITVDTPGSGSRMKRGIKLVADVNPLDIYTVSYTPLVSNCVVLPKDGVTLASIVDLSGDKGIRIISDNVLVLEPTRYSLDVATADIYLIIIMRRNTAYEHLTPAVEEYLLATGSIDSEKFASLY